MCCFFAAGAYFRQILHVYARTPGVSEEEIDKRYTQRGHFQFLGWLSLAFFFLKTLGLKGKMGNFWSGLSDFQLPNFLLVSALVIYLIGILGISLQIYAQKTEDRLNSIFDACISFGSTFSLVCYSYIHLFFSLDIPAWLIQLPGLLLVLINSIGIYLSFQPNLQNKILGNSCLWFVRHGEQVLAFIFFWAIAVTYAGMSPVKAIIFYGCLLVFMAWSTKRRESSILALACAIIGMAPLFFNIYSGEFTAKVKSQIAHIENLQEEVLRKDKCSIIQ